MIFVQSCLFLRKGTLPNVWILFGCNRSILLPKKITVGVFKAGWATHFGANIGRRVTRVAANHPNKDWRRKHPQDPIDSVFFRCKWEGWRDGRGWQVVFVFD